jgi:hypothetical protein
MKNPNVRSCVVNVRGAVRSAFIACVIVGSSAVQVVAAGPSAEVPVRIGAHADLDACGSWAEVSGLNPKGDAFLAVRSGPGTRYAIRDRLPEGATFYVCGDSSDGAWMSVVYPRKGQTQDDCDVSSPRPSGVYRGPCAYGWVNARWVNILAG